VVAASAGFRHSLLLDKAGCVYSCGWGGHGQLGHRPGSGAALGAKASAMAAEERARTAAERQVAKRAADAAGDSDDDAYPPDKVRAAAGCCALSPLSSFLFPPSSSLLRANRHCRPCI
jgi:alpha-tubulin suppressor-like RCC1 family protein